MTHPLSPSLYPPRPRAIPSLGPTNAKLLRDARAYLEDAGKAIEAQDFAAAAVNTRIANYILEGIVKAEEGK